MDDLSKITKQAKKALDLMENGKTFLAGHVIEHFKAAAELNPQDQLIGHMRDVLIKLSHKKEFFNQKEIAGIYDELYGLSGGQTAFRYHLAEFLPENHGILKTAQPKYSDRRADREDVLEPIFKDSELSKAFSSLFSMASKGGIGSYSDDLAKKAEKFVKAQLASFDLEPQAVKIAHGNQHFILCLATYDMPNFTQTHVKIPVPVTNGIPQLPENFIQGEQLVSLNKENLLVHIKDETNHRAKKNLGKFASERPGETLRTEPAVLPASLERYADLENQLVVAASKFTTQEISAANNIVTAELIGMGLSRPQAKLSHSSEKELVFDVEVPTKFGRAMISVPVEFYNKKPLMPTRFIAKGSKTEQIYDFEKSGLLRFIGTLASNQSNINLARQSGPMNQMSYHELTDRMIDGIASNDYRQAEDALATIGDRFDAAQYRTAFKQFTNLLKRSSNTSERNKLIKKAMEKGDLIMVPTSIEPYCPSLGLPASKIDFDDKGRIVPKHRKEKADNAIDSGTHISTSKIFLS